jgi:hypothetical protein
MNNVKTKKGHPMTTTDKQSEADRIWNEHEKTDLLVAEKMYALSKSLEQEVERLKKTMFRVWCHLSRGSVDSEILRTALNDKG